MNRRDKAARTQRPKTLKRRNAPKAARGRSTGAAGKKTSVARLARELKEAHEQQVATADVLKVIRRSPTDVQPVFDMIAESAARLCEGLFCFVYRFDGHLLHFVAHHSLTPEVLEMNRRAYPAPPSRRSAAARAILERSFVQIPDISSDPDYVLGSQAVVGRYRSVVGVPILRDGLPIGSIAVARAQAGLLPDRQIELLKTFADQAVIAIENVRLFEAEQRRKHELQESLEQQTATADVLKVISRSPGELEPVFEAMLASAVRICGAKFGNLWLCEGNSFRVTAMHGAPPAYADFLRRNSVINSVIPGTALGRIVSERQAIQIPDAENEKAYAKGTPFYTGTIELARARTIFAVPLLKDEELVGAIVIFRQEVRPFTDKQIDLLTNFASQAVIAIENTRLLNELRQRTDDLTESLEQQTATSEVLRVISSSGGELQPVFEALLANATKLCTASYGAMWLRDGAEVRNVAFFGRLPQKFEELWHAGSVIPADAEVPVARCIRTGEPIHVPDLKEDPSYREGNPLARGAVDLGGLCTLVAVPLLKEGGNIGGITIYRREVKPFSDKQIELVQNFAAQAVIAIENARLLSELRGSLDRQTAMSEVLSVISSSPGELEPVFESMLANAMHICEAHCGFIYRIEAGVMRTMAEVGVPPAFAEYRRNHTHTGGAKTLVDEMRATKKPAHVYDARESEAYRMGNPNAVAGVDLGGARTALYVPMLKDGEIVGVMNVYRQEVRPFTDDQIALLENFASQAVIAIENARLLSELRESLAQQTATANVLEVISRSAFDLQPVFETVAESAVRLCEADRAFIFRFDGELLRNVVAYNAPPELAKFIRENPIRPSQDSGAGRAALERRTVHIPDVTIDPNYTFKSKDIAPLRTVLSVPILKDDNLLGVILTYRLEVKPFTDKQIELVETFANQAIIAIENVHLFDEVQKRTRELSQSIDELRALGEVSQAVNSTLDLETVLTTIVRRAVELSRTDAGAIYVFNEQSEEFRLHATHGMSEAMIAAISSQSIGRGDGNNIATATMDRKPVEVADTRNEPTSVVNDIVLREGYRSVLIIPLLRPDHIVGALVVRRKTPGNFPQSAIELLQTFADQSVVAIQNARLYENVETRTRQLAKSLDDLRTTQDRLVQTQKLASLGQLTAGIAHEIKNPLNFVNNFSGVSAELIDELQDALKDLAIDPKARVEINELTDMLRGNLDKVVQHGKRADAIVKNMLLHSREGSGEHRPVDINTVVEESLNLAYHGARAEKQGFNITLERSFDPAAGEIDVFPQDITRALLNFILNGFYAAAKRNAEGNGSGYEPTLTAATKSLGDRVEIRIRDNGTGISPDVKEKMFNPFFTTKPAGEGTGLGLSISHDIVVKQHGGSIEVDTQPGEFTEIRVILPRAAMVLTESS